MMHATCHAGLDGPDRHPELVGDLGLGAMVEVRHLERYALRFWQLAERPTDLRCPNQALYQFAAVVTDQIAEVIDIDHVMLPTAQVIYRPVTSNTEHEALEAPAGVVALASTPEF